MTLQDMAVLLGLHTDGPPITGTDDRIWVDESERLLGVMPPSMAIEGGQVKLMWFREEF